MTMDEDKLIGKKKKRGKEKGVERRRKGKRKQLSEEEQKKQEGYKVRVFTFFPIFPICLSLLHPVTYLPTISYEGCVCVT